MSEREALAEITSDRMNHECGHAGMPDSFVLGRCPYCWDEGLKIADAILAAGYRKQEAAA